MKERYLDFILGRLSESETAVFLEQVRRSPESAREFEDFKRLFKLTGALRDAKFDVGEDFTEVVMEQVQERTIEVEKAPDAWVFRTAVAAPAALAAVGMLALLMTFRDAPPRDLRPRPEPFIEETPSAASNEAYEDLMKYMSDDQGKYQSGTGIQPAVEAQLERLQREQLSGEQKLSGVITEITGRLESFDETLKREGSTGASSGIVEARLGQAMSDDSRSKGETLYSTLDADKDRNREVLRSSVVASGNPREYGGYRRPPFANASRTGTVFVPASNIPEPYGSMHQQMQPPSSTEQYQWSAEGQRIIVASQPISTFSIDVDTGSYTNTRRFLRSGQLPPPSSVRIEEYLNYFDYQYPEAEAGKPFGMNYEIAPSPFEAGRHLLRIGMKAAVPAVNEDRGWNLVFLIDVSGSMDQPAKLPLLKQSLNAFVRRMRPVDRVAIVTYADGAQVALESTSGRDSDRIVAAIDRLVAHGSTNGSGGIQKAYEIAERTRTNDGVNRIVLATDGDFNVGISSFDELMRLIEEKRRSGVTLTTIGVGSGNLNERNLEQLANKGNGSYIYLDSFQEAQRALGAKLTANMEVVAKDVKLNVEFNPAVVSTYRLIGYDNRTLERQDFNSDASDAGEIGSGHTVTALYEITLLGSAATGVIDPLRYSDAPQPPPVGKGKADEIGFLKVRFKEPASNTSTLLQFPISRARVIADGGSASNDFRFAAAVAHFGEVLRLSAFAKHISLHQVRQLAANSTGADPTGDRREFISLVESVMALKGQK